MEIENPKVDKTTKVKNEKPSLNKRLDMDTANVLKNLKNKANKKSFGNKVTDLSIIRVALQQVTEEHIKQLQEKSLKGDDHIKMAHEAYIKKNGKISKDEYLRILASRDLAL